MLGANHSFFEEEAKDKEEEEYKEESEEETEKKKGTQGVNEIENPNLVKPKNSKARDVDEHLWRHLTIHMRNADWLWFLCSNQAMTFVVTFSNLASTRKSLFTFCHRLEEKLLDMIICYANLLIPCSAPHV
ncbi:uncharacterized protein LOC131219407 isoform X1 [Magnolia sinica]|uniref:uncharacterized protein LOC131219407 isoform X1 n=1 Tax=Magnolia sinica TaxID=86752 RepID=UPI002658183B|nr:uncharacterized protein LOC131219407 isoform X1 [Magnolia sinica]